MIEIDGIRNALHEPGTEAGDYVSDDFYGVIELSTAPGGLGREYTHGLLRLIRSLNRNIDATAVYLRQHELHGVYNDVVGQLNEINDVIGLGGLALITDDTGDLGYSSDFIQAEESVTLLVKGHPNFF